MKIVTFNIRCSWDNDGINSFLHRAGAILNKIDAEQPDIIAFQEFREKNYEFFKKHMPGYTLIGHGRDADMGGEGVYIAFKDTARLINFDTFWLSETPDIPGSRFPIQSKCPRTCVDALFMCGDRLIRVVDVHLDHESDAARILGIKQIMDRVGKDLKRITSKIVILGDFNARPDSDTISYINGCDVLDITREIPFTFHNYGKRESKIDYIYTDKDTANEVYSVTAWKDETDGIYLSDHYPVAFEF